VDKILLLRDKDGVIEACLEGERQSNTLCVQLTSETGEPHWPVLEEQEIYLSAQEMDRLVAWWQQVRTQDQPPRPQ